MKAGLARRGEPGSRGAWGWEFALSPCVQRPSGYSLWFALGQVHAGPVAVDPLDIGLAVALASWAVLCSERGSSMPLRRRGWLPVCLVGVLFRAGMIGFAQGHDWQSVLRDARVAACYSLLAIAPQLLKDRRSAERLVLFIIGLTIAAAAFAGASLLFGWHWQSGLAQVPTSYGVVSRGYGLPSALPWYCLGVLFCFGLCFLLRWRSLAEARRGRAGFGLAGVTLSTLVRSNYVGLPPALLRSSVAALAQRGGVRSFARWLGWRRAAGRHSSSCSRCTRGGPYSGLAQPRVHVHPHSTCEERRRSGNVVGRRPQSPIARPGA